MEFLQRNIAVGWVGVDHGVHNRPAALGTHVVEIKGKSHGAVLSHAGKHRTLKRSPRGRMVQAPCDDAQFTNDAPIGVPCPELCTIAYIASAKKRGDERYVGR